MTAIITQKFRLQQAELFKDSFDSSDTNLYLFVGKSSPWTNDTNPDLPANTIAQEYESWNDAIAVKELVSANVTYCIPRINWETNKIYVPYRYDDSDLYNHPTATETGLDSRYSGTYVITSDLKVYLCMDNAGGTVTTTMPTDTSVSVITTADGYKWKYLFTVSASDTLKYVTDEWIPVKVLETDDGSNQWDVQLAATSGAIEYAAVTDGGSGYDRTQTNQTPAGGSSNTLICSGAAVGTTGYYVGCSIYLSNGEVGVITSYDGSSRTATISGTWVQGPTVAGITYDILPTITVTGDGSGAIIKPIVTSEVITGTEVIAGGSGYTVVNITVTDNVDGGTGAEISPVIGYTGGIGSNPVKDLGASYVMMNVKLEYNEGEGAFPTGNDYRRIGLVKDITNYGSSVLATATSGRACKQLTLTAETDDFTPDEVFYDTSTTSIRGIVIEYLSADGTLKYYQDTTTGFGTFTAGANIVGVTSAAEAEISTSDDPDVQPNSGDVVYVEQRRPVTRSADQEEDIKIVIEF